MVQFKHLPSIDQEGNQTLLTIASGPVIFKEDKVLAVLLDRHEDDFWKFPGGRVDSNQSFESVAKMRVKEELDIEVEVTGEPFIVNFVWEKDGKQETVVLIHYLAKIVSGELKPQGDVTEFAWHNIDELPEDCAPNIKPVVEHFRKQL